MSVYRFFSGLLGFISSQANVLAPGGITINNLGLPQRASKAFGVGATGYPSLIFNQQTIEQYFVVMDMLSEMYMFSIAGVATQFIANAALQSMREELSVSVLSEDHRFAQRASDYLSDYFKNIDIKKIVRSIIQDIIYYGSYSFWLEGEEIQALYDPYATVTVLGPNFKELGYILNEPTTMILVKKENSKLIKIGSEDLILYSSSISSEDLDEYLLDQYPRYKNFSRFWGHIEDMPKNKRFIRTYIFNASLPLFYYVRMQLREYIVKQVTLALSTLRDLLFPIVYTLQYEYPAISYTVTNLATQIEDILNEYVDVSGLIGVQGNLTRILQAITYYIRVLPDFKGYITNLQPVDTTKLTEKLDKYYSDLSNLSDQIFEELGIPFKEKQTYWEGMKQNERFADKIMALTSSIDQSISKWGKILVKNKFKNYDKDYNVNISLFDISIGKMARMQSSAEDINTYLTTSAQMIKDAISNLGVDEEYADKFYDFDKVVSFLKSNMKYVFPDIDSMIKWEQLKEVINIAQSNAIKEIKENLIQSEEEEEEDRWGRASISAGEEESEEESEKETQEQEETEESKSEETAE